MDAVILLNRTADTLAFLSKFQNDHSSLKLNVMA
jgi:hypothetical protein